TDNQMNEAFCKCLVLLSLVCTCSDFQSITSLKGSCRKALCPERCPWEAVGLRTDLLRRRKIGPYLRVFSAHRHHYAPQKRENLVSIFHSPRYDRLSPTASRIDKKAPQKTCPQLSLRRWGCC